MIYNVTQLAEGSNIVEWMIIVNSWTSGSLAIGVLICGAAVTFGIGSMVGQRVEYAFAGATFLWGIIATFLWILEFQGERVLPTLIPVLFWVVCALAMFGGMIRDWTTRP